MYDEQVEPVIRSTTQSGPDIRPGDEYETAAGDPQRVGVSSSSAPNPNATQSLPRYRPPTEVTKAAKARRALRERTAGRDLTRDEKRLDRRYSAVVDPFEALSLEERLERWGLHETESE